MTTASHELALYVINNNWPVRNYDWRLEAAKQRNPRLKAIGFTILAGIGSRRYCTEFGYDNRTTFTTKDILLAAVELVDYYEERAREDTNVA